MKISREWLQTYFDKELPSVEDLAHALTFHAFEIDGVDNDVLDVKVTPNRGHDCLSYRGIAKEVSAILDIPLSGAAQDAWGQREDFTLSMTVSVNIAEPDLCPRYIAWAIKGVKVGPSPKWLVDRLAAQGQQSINNVVDATNYVMFSVGQPLHAFDAGKLKDGKDGAYAIEVRRAQNGEKIIALDHKEYELRDSMLVIVDAHAHVPVGIAGVKGGMPAGITDETVDIIIESANFDGVSVRKTAQALKLRTDASQRFEQQISPELAAYGMRAAAKLIRDIAGGELAGFADVYVKPQEKRTVSVTLTKINQLLGTEFTMADVEGVFKGLGLEFTTEKGIFVVDIPHERLDISIPEDLVEEVGRIIGYDKVPSVELPAPEGRPEINERYYAAEYARQDLISKGFSEVYTSVFVEKGERAVANKIDGERPFLRTNLLEGLSAPLVKNVRNKDLLGLGKVKLFEIGPVWTGGKEEMHIYWIEEEKSTKDGAVSGKQSVEMTLEAYASKNIDTKPTGYLDLPASELTRYQPFSRFPFIVRDIALWVPAETNDTDVLEVILHHAGHLVVRSAKFDEFKKGDRTSYAFRLVFQSPDRTLFDEDANQRMESVYAAVKEKGWEVR